MWDLQCNTCCEPQRLLFIETFMLEILNEVRLNWISVVMFYFILFFADFGLNSIINVRLRAKPVTNTSDFTRHVIYQRVH